MKAKSILIPIAAFALTATGVSAFNSDVLEKAGLTDEQRSAFEVARELREEGDKDGARDVLIEAGIDEDVIERVRTAMHEYRQENRGAIHDAVLNNDFDAFQTAIEGSPIADIVTTQADFDLFVEAHNLRQDGNHDEARVIMEELGFEEGMGHRKGPGKMEEGREDRDVTQAPFYDDLTAEQQEALLTARSANDRKAAQAILEEAGIDMPKHGERGGMRGMRHADDSEV